MRSSPSAAFFPTPWGLWWENPRIAAQLLKDQRHRWPVREPDQVIDRPYSRLGSSSLKSVMEVLITEHCTPSLSRNSSIAGRTLLLFSRW